MRDLYGEYHDCLNCGYHDDVMEGPPIELKPLSRKVAKVKRVQGPSRRGQKL